MQEILQKRLAILKKSVIMHLFDDDMTAAIMCGMKTKT